ncbi:MAG: sigma-54-dependent Fis family transcriptional regulator [Deltaproteobacteria bacterium]|nr:sigma-54-dependent Fis family transcriptional regulator [Deltaproteobacteria bacterium]
MKSSPGLENRVLVVDDDIGLLLSIKATIASSGLPEPMVVADSRTVMDLVRTNSFHLLVLDLIMPHIGGMDILRQVKEEFPTTECIIITAVDDVSHAVQAMKYGAFDYLVKPVNSEKLIITVNRALERYNLRNKLALFEKKPSYTDLKNPAAFEAMVAEDQAMAMVFHQAEIAAPTDYNVVLTGESGTGKEMLARIIHNLSNRSNGNFVAVNMASFSKTLFEDDFFGHVKGAYTGAFSEKKGFFEAAQGGTLFLDEITELEQALQGKMLRVIEERELYRLGSTESRNVDVRVISATNADIEEEIKNGRFRKDLFFRLNMFHINIPPLRERKDDILPLARHFLRRHAEKNDKNIQTIDPDLVECLLDYPYPGNVRELENIIAKTVLLEEEPFLSLASAQEIKSFRPPAGKRGVGLMPLDEIEKQHIMHVLESTGHNRTQAARILGIGLRTLQRKLKLFDCNRTMP